MSDPKKDGVLIEHQVEIRDDVADGTYANVANIVYSPVEFIFDFGRTVPGRQNIKVLSRIITTPVHAKQFLLNLTQSIERFEQQFGEIRIPHSNLPDGPPGFKQ